MKSLTKIKKISKVIGSLFIGLSLTAGAALGAYPDTFMKDGKVDGSTLLIVGADANAADTLGVLDLKGDLERRSVVCTANPEAGKITVSGDKISISESSDLLELYEPIGDVKETLTEDDLEGLESDEINTGEGTTDYNQYLRFEENDNSIASLTGVYDEDEDDKVGDYLHVKDGEVMYEYEMEFEDGLESDIKDGELRDLEDERITMLGQPYTIVSAEIDTDKKDIELLFLSGASTELMHEGDNKTIMVGDKEYNVNVMLISDYERREDNVVKFEINGEILDKMEEGETETLEDGTIIGVEEILNNEAGEGADQVTFFIGANKLEFRDKYNDDAFSARVEINDENIEDAKVKIKGIENGNEFEITSIKYRLEADADGGGDIYIKPGEGLREQLDEPEGMFGDWDIIYNGLDVTGVSEVRIRSSGDDEYNLHFENRRGIEYSIPFASTDGDFKYGDEDDELIYTEGKVFNGTQEYTIPEDAYFVVTDDNDETGNTHILRYESIDEDNNQITFNDEGADSFEVTYEGDEGVDAKGEIIVGGNTYDFYVGPAPDFNIAVDLNNDGKIDGGEANIVIKGGGILDLNPIVNGTLPFTLRTLASEFDEPDADEEIDFIIKDKGDELDIDVTGVNLINHDKGDLESGMTPYGVYVEMEDDDNDDPEDVTIEYPLSQRGVDVSVVMGEVTTTTAASEICGAPTVDINYFLDTEVDADQLDEQPVILVGGPAVNLHTAEVLGLDYPTYGSQLGMQVGESIVELVEEGRENVAMIIYGHSREDTREAVKELLEE